MTVPLQDPNSKQTGCEFFRATDNCLASGVSPLLAITPGLTQVLHSMAWPGLLVEKHFCSPGVRNSAVSDRHVISMVSVSPSRFEYRTLAGEFKPHLGRPGDLMVTPQGPVPDLRLSTSATFIHCALQDEFVRSVLDGSDRKSGSEPRFSFGFQDKPTQRIIGLLMEEVEAQHPFGHLYVDSLAHALATRYLLLDSNMNPRPESRVSALPTRLLNRVKELIAANLEAELRVEMLADEIGYSRAHFLRMFRAATGLTPHQYVLDLRLSRAQDYLKKKDASIVDIAVACGFSSQSHMTSVFRQRLEITPGEYRRSA